MAPVRGLPSALKLTASRHGARIALQDGEVVLTYAELWQRIELFAAALQARRILPGDRLALSLEPGWQYVVALYGTLLSGAIVVPLNPAARTEELRRWADHAQAAMVIDSNAAFREVQGAVDAASPSACAFGDDMPACIHYTSGTTGAPKGVLLSHGNLLGNARAIVDYLALTPDDCTVCVLPFCYAYGSSVLHSSLLAGARLVIERGFTFPHKVMATVARERATGFAGVPATFALLLARVDVAGLDLSALRYLTQAGGPMAPALTARLRSAFPQSRIYIMYGQTEATARITYLPPERIQDKSGSVGKPIQGVELSIRSDSGLECAVGEIGRIHVRGPNVMLGYWRDAEATDRVLRDGWLDTGDVGHRDSEGFLFISGRRSDIIKAGAHRVHPQDVENVIGEMEAVEEVAVVGMEDELLGEVIRAFVVSRPGTQLSEQQVKRHCLERLAAYKVPKQVSIVPNLPRTASGKIRRVALINEEE